MNTPCKILAMAWMALRPFSTNVHADNINWEEVLHFFNFDTITEREKQANLKTNIRLLVEEQLKLPSGKNLWKAFQFWENQHPELGFQFEFTLTPNPGAEVVLERLKYSFEGKQVFCFEILINKLFAEKLEADRILSENMLYRPCLIKLVDSDDPERWEYHLREQELPFFITLAHEFLHALNQLERIGWILGSLGMRTMEELFMKLNLINSNVCNENNLVCNILCLFNKGKINKHNLLNFYEQLKLKYDNYLNGKFPFAEVLEAIFPIQNFLQRKLSLRNDAEILLQKYKDLWSNDNCDDSLDEMTVILQSKRKIGFMETTYIGETSFLQEYYNNPFIISWSHYSAHSVKFFEKMAMLLEKNYINKMICCNKFKIHQQTIQNFLKKII